MMLNPLLSIIIPCYRQGHLVGRAIRSCLEGNNNLSMEIIVVDDGSPDDVAKSVEKFGKIIKLVKKENGGLSSARNAALKIAKGKFVKFLDSDDWLLPGSLSQQVAILQQVPDKILITGYSLSYEDSWRADEKRYPFFGSWKAALAGDNIGPPHIFTLSMDLARQVGDFDEKLSTHEDYDYWCRAALLGVEAVVLHSVECTYYQHTSNMSRDFIKMQINSITVWKRYIDQIVQNGLSRSEGIEFFNNCAKFIKCNIVDHSAQSIADTLISHILHLWNRAGIEDAMLIGRAATGLLPFCSRESRLNIHHDVRSKVSQYVNHTKGEYEKRHIQRSLLETGQLLIRKGEKKSAFIFFQCIYVIGKTYGFDYVAGAKFQRFLCAMLPGKLAVAVYLKVRALYKKYQSKQNEISTGLR